MKKSALIHNKVSIIGCGRVGATIGYTLTIQGLTNELVLLGRCRDRIVGEELDMEHGLAFLSPTKITSTENYQDIAGSQVVIISAGASQKPGETRLDLLSKNIKIIEQIIPQVVAHAPEAVILMVSNPVDILTYKAYQLAGLPKGQIIGSGTTLDTARFRFHLSEFLKVSPQSIHAYILGEHGDSSFPVISSATVGGQPLLSMPNITEEKVMDAFQKAKSAAYRIIESKGSTYYGIGVSVAHIVDSILGNERNILPLSIPLHNYHDQFGIALSVPCVVGEKGVSQSIDIKLSWQEKEKLERSVEKLKSYL